MEKKKKKNNQKKSPVKTVRERPSNNLSSLGLHSGKKQKEKIIGKENVDFNIDNVYFYRVCMHRSCITYQYSVL